MKKRYSAAFIAMVVAGLLAMFNRTEQVRLVAYQDGAGVWTICRGETDGVKQGDRKTPAECHRWDEKVSSSEVIFVLDKTNPRLSVPQAIGLAHFMHNVGRTAFVNSAVRRDINAGNLQAGCDAIRDYHYIHKNKRKIDCSKPEGKHLCGGLIPRREEERALCLQH